MAIKTRNEIINPTDVVKLVAQFRDENDTPIDLDAFPNVTIVQPSGAVLLGPTNMGVYRSDVGLYGYTLEIGLVGPLGVWADVWEGIFQGELAAGNFSFTVFTSQMPMVNSDGYASLGDDPGFNYSQNAILNINKLLKSLRARLNSSGKSRTFDQFGNSVFEDCDIFTIDQLVVFLCNSLTWLNECPHWSFYSWEDTSILDQFHNLIVQGAAIMALSSQALIERGREFQLNDNGVTFTPPGVSELLNTQFGTELANHMERIKLVKFNMKPQALGLGIFRNTSISPQLARQRHRREGGWWVR